MDDALEFPRDDEGRIVGFQVGKAHRLADWATRREIRETDRMINVARVVDWQRKNPAKVAAKNARHNAKPAAKARRKAYHRKRRAAEYRKNPVVCACEECGSTWCKVPWVKGKVPRYCSTRCTQRARTRRVLGREPGPVRQGRKAPAPKPAPPRRPYQCSVCGGFGHNRAAHQRGPRGVVGG